MRPCSREKSDLIEHNGFLQHAFDQLTQPDSDDDAMQHESTRRDLTQCVKLALANDTKV
jgi:hypothetical protein